MAQRKQRIRRKQLGLFLGFLMTLCGLVSFTSIANEIQSVRVEAFPNHTQIVFGTKSTPVFSYFSLFDTADKRLVLDFVSTKSQVSWPQKDFNTYVIKQIRTSTPAKPDSFRLVIELSEAMEAKVFHRQAGQGHQLVVELPIGLPNAHQQNSPSATEPAIKSTGTQKLRPVVIAVDAGHGGRDPGSIGPAGTYEKIITLAVSQRLARIINADPAMEAVLIRTGDYSLSLKARASLIRKARADFVVSIHADAFTSPQPSGASVWVLSPVRARTELGRALEDKERLSEELHELSSSLQDDDNNSYLAYTLLDMRRDNSMQDSALAAETLLTQLGKITNLHKSTPQGGSFAVLSNLGTPSALVELGFISNPRQEKMLLNGNHQEKIAKALYQGLRNHFIQHPISDGLLGNQQIYTVKRGDTLSVLARRYNTSVDAILAANGLKNANIRVGQSLLIPSA